MPPPEISPAGRHLVLELYECDRAKLVSTSLVRRILLELADHIGAKVLSESFFEFEPYGITGVVVIGESHLAIHTWPEHRYASVDIFTCGNIASDQGIQFCVQEFGAKKFRYLLLLRGATAASDKQMTPLDVSALCRIQDVSNE